MALAKDFNQTSSRSFYENILGVVGSTVEFSHITSLNYGFDHYDQQHQEENALESPNNNNNNIMISNNNQVISNNNNSPTISSSSSGNSTHHHEEDHSLIKFKSGFGSSIMDSNNGSLLTFLNDHKPPPENYKKLINHPTNYPINHYNHNSNNAYELYLEPNIVHPTQDSTTQPTCFNKRPNDTEEEIKYASKKQCRSASKRPTKVKIEKDPQSVAAKNRRERISERLKILQDLVPNGSKVDLVTMLEKAISYVKFLQLQVKVLGTDEFWPVSSDKAPDVSQVREAVDAILLSQRSSQSTTTTTSPSNNLNY